MQEWNISHEAIKALFSSLGSLFTLLAALGLGWFVGSRVTYSWNMRQRRREFQLSALEQFYKAYGEFFAVWKLWSSLLRSSVRLEDRKWELHNRAATAEATIEGTLVKLSSEMRLEAEDIDALGRFRQRFQQLRESIRDGMDLGWTSSENADYREFKCLAVHISFLLAKDWTGRCTREEAGSQLFAVTSNTFEAR